MQIKKTTSIRPAFAGLLFATMAQPALAGELSIPHQFNAGSKAVAAEVNANFTAVETAVDDNDSRITALLDRIADLEAALDNLQANTVLDLDGKLELVTDDYGYASARFSGVNVQIINGVDQTTANGVGNLIVGYNQPRDTLYFICSDGQYDNEADCNTNGGLWADSHKSGSHNLVAGDANSYSATGGVVFGVYNAINRDYAVVTGGTLNIASGSRSSVSGGYSNTASGYSSSVSGGRGNTASGSRSSVSGGYGNIGSNDYSSVSGGRYNTASGSRSSVSGGYGNTASGLNSSVSGGQGNTASGLNSSVSGGKNRSAIGLDDWSAGDLYENN